MENKQFLGLDCVELGNESLSLMVTKSVGPRIISLRYNEGENLFAELPDRTIECPGHGELHLWGGHRLWHAPEEPRRTYLPDDNPVYIEEVPSGLRITQPVEAETSIEKSITITLHEQLPQIVVNHALKNCGLQPVELAPWTITQMKSGGTAILPQATEIVDEHGVLPNRNIALWPYTQIDSPFITWGDQFIFIHSRMEKGALKLGFPNPKGWLAYALNETLFVKFADYQPTAEYFDRGSSSECYCSQHFLELETLGPRQTLAPDERVIHRETWKVYPIADFKPTQDHVIKLVNRLEL